MNFYVLKTNSNIIFVIFKMYIKLYNIYKILIILLYLYKFIYKLYSYFLDISKESILKFKTINELNFINISKEKEFK